jgi:hypothetical protein
LHSMEPPARLTTSWSGRGGGVMEREAVAAAKLAEGKAALVLAQSVVAEGGFAGREGGVGSVVAEGGVVAQYGAGNVLNDELVGAGRRGDGAGGLGGGEVGGREGGVGTGSVVAEGQASFVTESEGAGELAGA